MFTVTLILSTILDCGLLGSDHYPAREAAGVRLWAAGPLAWPALLAAQGSGSAEVRHRAGAMLAPYRSWVKDRAASEVLTGPWPADAAALCGDDEMRLRVHRLGLRLGLPEGYVGYIHPDAVYYGGLWWCIPVPPDVMAETLARCRRRLGFASWLE